MYICRRAEPELINLDEGGGSEPKVLDQWWRVHYAPFEVKPVVIEVCESIGLRLILA